MDIRFLSSLPSNSILKHINYPTLFCKHKKIFSILLIALGCLVFCYSLIKVYFSNFKNKIFTSLSEKPLKDNLNQNKKIISDFPTSCLISIFTALDVQDWNRLSRVNRDFRQLSKNSIVMAYLVEKLYLPHEKRLEIAKIAALSLTKLNLEGSDQDPEDLKTVLQVCANLQMLNLSGFPDLRDEHLKFLSSKKIEFFDISNCENLTSDILSKVSSCKHLILSGCEKILENVNPPWPKELERLDLSDSMNVTDELIENLNLPKLKSLNLSRCPKVKDSTLEKLKLKEGLIELFLSGCKEINGSHFYCLPKSIRKLYLSGCENISYGLNRIRAELVFLDLSRCPQLRDEHLDGLSNTIDILKLSHCVNLTPNVLKKINKIKKIDFAGCYAILKYLKKSKLIKSSRP